MTSYVGMDDVSFAIHNDAGGWYINLGDVAFWLKNDDDPGEREEGRGQGCFCFY